MKMCAILFKIFIILIICVFKIKCQSWRERKPTVRLQQGLLEGVKIYTESSKTIEAYLRIPYASPPTGNFRFAPPQRHSGWNGTLQAGEFGEPCPQLPFKSGSTQNEDCLFLNIWTPENAASYAPLPVVIFIEGENFAKSNAPISGEDLATEGIVVVTLNYRLSIFGFLCLGNSEARGNLGILDQYLALLWVKENVKQFGGDPEKITLYGHSSGAVSVSLHMISPRSAGLFQRAIITSGSAVAPWQTNNDPIIASREMIRLLSCDVYTRNPLSCLRSKSLEQIMQALEEYTQSFNWNDEFLPVIDTFLPENDRYLPEEPIKALKDGTYLQVPILTGISKPITNPQFSQWLELASQGYSQLQQYAEKAKLPEIMRLYKFSTPSKDQIFDLIKWKYLSSNQGDVRILFQQLKNLDFESKIEAPHFLQLSLLLSSYVQPIFVYYMDIIGFVVNNTDSSITSDLLLIFGPIVLKQVGRRRFNPNELRLSKELKKLWTNFIIFGNPTPNNHAKTWRKYATGDYYIEDFGTIQGNIIEETQNKNQRVNFWNVLLPKISTMQNNLSNNIPRELQNNTDSASSFRHGLYTLVALVIALLGLLLVCIFLLKKRSKERERHLHLGWDPGVSTVFQETYKILNNERNSSLK